jgi:hypothetical protein
VGPRAGFNGMEKNLPGFKLWNLSELLGFWTLSTVQNSKYYKTQRFRNWIYFHPNAMGGRRTLLGPLERANFNHSFRHPCHSPHSQSLYWLYYPHIYVVLLWNWSKWLKACSAKWKKSESWQNLAKNDGSQQWRDIGRSRSSTIGCRACQNLLHRMDMQI